MGCVESVSKSEKSSNKVRNLQYSYCNICNRGGLNSMDTFSFEEWMRLVNEHVILVCGLPVEEMDEVMFHDFFEDGVSTKRAACRAIARTMDSQ